MSQPTQNQPEDHLSHLLTEIGQPWYVSLKNRITEAFEPKQPPLEVTSTPVPVAEIWNDYRYGRISGPASVVLHSLLVTLILLASMGQVVHQKPQASEGPRVIDFPPASAWLGGGGGGGGDRSETPASKGRPAPFALDQLAQPTVKILNENPALPAPMSIVGPPDIQLPEPNLAQLGVQFGPIGLLSNGPGEGGGQGDGRRGGQGPGDGPGRGPGKLGGFGGGEPFRPGIGGVTRPELIYRVEPEYTDAARKARHMGTVRLQVIVEADGRVRDVRLASALGMGLDEKAIEAVRKWIFRPATKDGRPVPVVAVVDVTFRLL